jgi:predicted nuclease with RNAse H fold
VITLGIDLAAEPRDTASCHIEWRDGRAGVRSLVLGRDDAELLHDAEGALAIGIDAPFGWPEAFVRAVSAHHALEPADIHWTPELRRRLRLRVTDIFVNRETGLWPLSVSTDAIAVPALRCAGLLAALDVRDRSGDGRVFEVYPAASLHRWGLPSRGYKEKKGLLVRNALFEALRDRTPFLEIPGAARDLCIASDDALDALVCAIIARAATLGRTARATDNLASREGWIALPDADVLAHLV